MPAIDPNLSNRINELIAEFLRNNPQQRWPSQEAMIQALFLSLAGSDVDDYNARRCFVELVTTPSPEDIVEYARVATARRWAAGDEGVFYHKNRKSSRPPHLQPSLT